MSRGVIVEHILTTRKKACDLCNIEFGVCRWSVQVNSLRVLPSALCALCNWREFERYFIRILRPADGRGRVNVHVLLPFEKP